MGEDLICDFALPCHPLGSGLAHSDGVAVASARDKGPFAADVCDFAGGASDFFACRINGKPKVFCSQEADFAGSSGEFDRSHPRELAVVAFGDGSYGGDLAEVFQLRIFLGYLHGDVCSVEFSHWPEEKTRLCHVFTVWAVYADQ